MAENGLLLRRGLPGLARRVEDGEKLSYGHIVAPSKRIWSTGNPLLFLNDGIFGASCLSRLVNFLGNDAPA
jgi:hypothetical protein